MRILIVSTYYPFPPSIGGIETIVRNVAKELAGRGHSVAITSSTYDPVTQKSVTNTGMEVIDDVKVYKLESLNLKIGYARLLKNLETVISKENPEIIHLHNIHPPLFQVLRLKSTHRFRIVLEPHHPAVELEYLSSKLFFPLVVRALRIFEKKIDVILTHTDLEYQWFAEKGFNEERLRKILFPGIDKSLLEYNYKFEDKDNTIVYVGRIIPRKGIHLLIDALNMIRDRGLSFKLILIGSRDEEYFKTVKKRILDYGLDANIVYRGVVSEKEKIETIAHAILLVLPSISDYTPNVLLEAQALGTPVVASNVGAVRELVKPGITGFLVEPGNVKDLAEAVTRLLVDRELARKMSYSARVFAREHTIDKKVDQLEKLYEELT